jgi:hypothetical protein
MFLRPPRFGQSLLKSTLHSYYDVNQEKDIDTLFGISTSERSQLR